VTEITKLEELADRFIDSYLKDHPIMIYILDGELEEFLEDVEELKNQEYLNQILQDYFKTEKKKVIDQEIYGEIINAAEKVLNPSGEENDEDDYLNIPLLELMRSCADLLVYELMQLVVRDNKVRIREIHELEETQQEDPYSPNRWIYHKSWNLKKVLNYIRQYNEGITKNDELEEPKDFRR
jgi:hypothetical protein